MRIGVLELIVILGVILLVSAVFALLMMRKR